MLVLLKGKCSLDSRVAATAVGVASASNEINVIDNHLASY